MSTTIYKYDLIVRETVAIELPQGARIPGTGFSVVEPYGLDYLDTVLAEDGAFVVHVFERVKVKMKECGVPWDALIGAATFAVGYLLASLSIWLRNR